MNKQNVIRMICDLADAKGAPGFEGEVALKVQELSESLGTVVQDKMNNVYLDRKGNQHALDEPFTPTDPKRTIRVQLDAHMDEVAFMVQSILPNGCLSFVPLGGWVTSNIPAHKVWIRTGSGQYIKGLTTSKPPHFMSAAEKDSALSLDQIVIDVGSSSARETEELGIEIGAPIVPAVQCEYDEKRDLFLGKAFDCRSGCAAILDTLDTLKEEKLNCDVYAGFSTQEEVGTRGAQLTARRIKPDIAIVFEGCPADDTFGDPARSQTRLRKGPMLRHLDARMVTHPGFQKFALDLAVQAEIPVQRAVRTGGSTNGAPIHLSNLGVPCIVIGLPVRYIHTHYGFASYADHHAAVRLACEILKNLNRETFAGI